MVGPSPVHAVAAWARARGTARRPTHSRRALALWTIECVTEQTDSKPEAEKSQQSFFFS